MGVSQWANINRLAKNVLAISLVAAHHFIYSLALELYGEINKLIRY